MSQDWYTKERTEKDGKKGWLFEVHEGNSSFEQFLYDEGLQLKFVLGGYESAGATLAFCWTEECWFTESNFQCYVKNEGNPLHPVKQDSD